MSELAEFKEQVREVAKRYAEANDWCEEVDRALREMGLEGICEQPVPIVVTIGLPATITVEVTPSVWGGLDEAGQKALIEANLYVSDERVGVYTRDGDAVAFSDGDTGYYPTFRDVKVLTLGNVVDGVPVGYVWAFVSNRGRVRHLLTTSGTYRDGLCGVQVRENFLTLHSPRNEGRLCAQCEQKAGALGA